MATRTSRVLNKLNRDPLSLYLDDDSFMCDLIAHD